MALIYFFSALLLASCAGMGAILWLKRYELTTGRVLLAGARPSLQAFFRRGLYWIERVLPGLAAALAARAWRHARLAARAATARGLLWAERSLEQLLAGLRRATTHHPRSSAGAAASPFLREVAEHKKKLQEGREDEQ